MFSMTAPAKVETKFAAPEDKFELLTTIPALAQWHVRKGNEKVISRSELELFGITPGYGCKQRWLRPLTPTAPEELGLSPAEVVEAYLPQTKDTPRKFEAAFKFLEDISVAPELRARCPDGHFTQSMNLDPSSQFVGAFYAVLAAQVTPACLLPILEANNGLATRLLLETPAEKFAGRGAFNAVENIVGMLLESRHTNQGTIPKHIGEFVLRLFAILSAIKPPRSLTLHRALVRYTRLPVADFPAEIEAAYDAYFECFLA